MMLILGFQFKAPARLRSHTSFGLDYESIKEVDLEVRGTWDSRKGTFIDPYLPTYLVLVWF